MAMRAALKKISPCNIRFLGGRQLIPPYSGGGSSRLGGRAYLHTNNKEVIPCAGEIKNWGKWISRESLCDKIDFCLEKLSQANLKEEEQQRLLKRFRWEYLIFFLQLEGFQTRQLLSIKSDHGIVQFDMGLRSKQLVLDHGSSPYGLPRQTVNGLVCITARGKEKFLIYNPSTGEASPWIETTAVSERRKKGESSREVDCIALGFDPTRNEYKVICVSTTFKKTSGFTVAQPDDAIIVEVLTLDSNTWTGTGESTWRRLRKDLTPTTCGSRYQLVGPPVYANGCVYWLYGPAKLCLLAEFDVQSETFLFYGVPPCIPKKGDILATQLMDLCGSVGALKRVSDYEASVCILVDLGYDNDPYDSDEDYVRDYGDNYKLKQSYWMEENISLPCAWTAGTHLSIEALAGTNMLFIKPENSDSVYCYNRNTKESERVQISDHHERIMQL